MRDEQMEHRGFLGQWKYSVIYHNDGNVIIHLSKPMECMTPRVNPDVNYGFGVTDVSLQIHQMQQIFHSMLIVGRLWGVGAGERRKSLYLPHLTSPRKKNLLNACETLMIKHSNFPGRAVVKNPPANAGDVGSIPALGRSHRLCNPHSRACALQLLSSQTITPEACVPQGLCSTAGEATAVRSPCTTMKSSPCPPQVEKVHAQKQRPSMAKIK